jgi:hypothetical protein
VVRSRLLMFVTAPVPKLEAKHQYFDGATETPQHESSVLLTPSVHRDQQSNFEHERAYHGLVAPERLLATAVQSVLVCEGTHDVARTCALPRHHALHVLAAAIVGELIDHCTRVLKSRT